MKKNTILGLFLGSDCGKVGKNYLCVQTIPVTKSHTFRLFCDLLFITDVIPDFSSHPFCDPLLKLFGDLIIISNNHKSIPQTQHKMSEYQ